MTEGPMGEVSFISYFSLGMILTMRNLTIINGIAVKYPSDTEIFQRLRIFIRVAVPSVTSNPEIDPGKNLS